MQRRQALQRERPPNVNKLLRFVRMRDAATSDFLDHTGALFTFSGTITFFGT